MARIIANGTGKAKGRTGLNYYRNVDGRTIMCILPGPSDSRKAAAKENINCAFMALVNMWMKAHATAIKVAFNRVKYGSERNYFMKINNDGLREAWGELAEKLAQGGKVSLGNLESALTSYATAKPESIYRVHRDGFEAVYLTGAWVDSIVLVPSLDKPVVTAVTGDTIEDGTPVRVYGAYLKGKVLTISYKADGGEAKTVDIIVYTDSPLLSLQLLNEATEGEASSYQLLAILYNGSQLWAANPTSAE